MSLRRSLSVGRVSFEPGLQRDVLLEVNLHVEQGEAKSLAVWVESERARNAFTGWTVQNEVERAQRRHAVSFNGAGDDRSKQLTHAFNGYLPFKCCIIVFAESDKRDIHDVALVASSGMSNLLKLHQATSSPIAGRIALRGRKVASIAIFSRKAVTAPPPPAGPLT